MGVLAENLDGALVVTINRPDAGNALNPAVGQGLVDALTDAATNPQIRTVIVTGAGHRVFCAGMDLKEAALTGLAVPPPGFLPIIGQNVSLSKPTIAAGLCRSRRQASLQSPLGASSWTSRASICATLTTRGSVG